MIRYFIFTVWIQDDGEYFGPRTRRVIIRTYGRIDEPNHETLKANTMERILLTSPDARVEFGPISLSKRQD